MSFLIVKSEMALVLFVLTTTVFFVMANENDVNSDCMICTRAWRSVNGSRPIKCFKNKSTVTIWLNKNESAYEEILLMFNKTDCEASLISKTKMRNNTRLCNLTQRKQCYFRREQAVYNQEELQITIRSDAEGQDESSRIKIPLKIRFKSGNRSNKQHSIVIRRNEHGDNGAFDCLLFGACNAKTDVCACSVQPVSMNNVSDTSEAYTTHGPQKKPELSEEERNERRTEMNISAVFSFVMLCLILEILLCVIFHHMQAKCRRTSSVEVENSTSNPVYQLSPQVLPSSYSFPLQDTDQESYQPSYQPLVENTRVPGVSTAYLTLADERGQASPWVAVDPASYQDLNQSEQRENGYQENLTQEDESGEPFYHIPEKTAANEEAPSTSESLRDTMYYVVKELKSINTNAPEKVPSEDSVEEPIYYTLEDPREIEVENTQDEKFLSSISS